MLLSTDYADYVNLIGNDIRITERNADVLLNSCKNIGLAVNKRVTKYMEVGRHRGMMTNEHITTGIIRMKKCNPLNILAVY